MKEAGLSWNGFNITGDAKSIDEVRRLIHAEERLRYFEQEHMRLSKAFTELSWKTNPDRSGGAFTEEEIRRAREWR